jgi:hypothetical protein
VSELHATLRNLRSCLAGAKSAWLLQWPDSTISLSPCRCQHRPVRRHSRRELWTRRRRGEAAVVRAVVATGAVDNIRRANMTTAPPPEAISLTVHCQFPSAVGATPRWGMGRACEPQATRALGTRHVSTLGPAGRFPVRSRERITAV